MFRFSAPSLKLGWLARKISKISFSTKSKCYYEILGVSPTATNSEIKEAFLTLSKKCHPDVTQANSAHHDFVKINEAYSVLSKKSSRNDYDVTRNLSRNPTGRTWHSASGQSEFMYEEWYRVTNTRPRWRPVDDFGPAPVPSNESMRKTFYFITLFFALSLFFQAFILSRNQERHHDRLVEEHRVWLREFEPKIKRKGDKEDRTINEKDSAGATGGDQTK